LQNYRLKSFLLVVRLLTFLCAVLLLVAKPMQALSQQKQYASDSLAPTNKYKHLKIGTALGIGYGGMLYGLNKAWYSHHERTRFHFFNDNLQWKQMDKAGHLWAAFHQSRAGADMLLHAGMPERKAIWLGGMLGILMQTPIEIMDGYSASYGASVGDQVANMAGSAALLSQYLYWGELRITPKYSFWPSNYAGVRPQVLGANLAEQMLKDYNGQTYWLSVGVASFLPTDTRYPAWLNLGLGYSATGMVYGDPVVNQAHGFNAYRQYFLALDIDLTKIKTRHTLLKKAFYVLNVIHVPGPAIEFSRQRGVRLHPVYF
jgi:uncharacterized protein YfiM (DUF2279 family)